MKKILKNKAFLFTISLLLCHVAIFSQDSDPGLPIGGDPGAPAAPIDSGLPFMVVVGMLILFYYAGNVKYLKD